MLPNPKMQQWKRSFQQKLVCSCPFQVAQDPAKLIYFFKCFSEVLSIQQILRYFIFDFTVNPSIVPWFFNTSLILKLYSYPALKLLIIYEVASLCLIKTAKNFLMKKSSLKLILKLYNYPALKLLIFYEVA